MTPEPSTARIPDSLADDTLALGKLILSFAETYRNTRLLNGDVFESDTDHTVMLGVIACAIAHEYEPSLDVGKIAQFALVHALVAVYAGDTDTFGMHKDENKKLDKERREAAAFERLE